MALRHLHVVSFDVPSPPDYGGVIDIYYKIRALAAAGVKIYLHCFQYGRAEAADLRNYCEEVYYYKRDEGKRFLFSSLPYIVATRHAEALVERLNQDNFPVLFEGLHSCFHLSDPRLAKRQKLVRCHNIEHDYYDSLAKVESNFLRKLYFKREASRLRHFERILNKASHILAISRADEENLKTRFANVTRISAFHPNERISVKNGRGDFALYHGNLEVGENNEAALYLVRDIFAGTDMKLVIAGKNPSAALRACSAKNPNIILKANIPTSEIDELIRDAQINVLPTFQATGIKLKLLAALYTGRHCVVNPPMVENTGLENLCLVFNDAVSMKAGLARCFAREFDRADILMRENLLYPLFSNKAGVEKLLELIDPFE